METGRYLDALHGDAEALAVAAERDFAAAVPACPGWTTARLVGHVGRIHRWAAEMVRTSAQERIDRDQMPPIPPVEELMAWYRAGAASLVDALTAADAETPMWTFNARRTTAFWFRRQAQETSVHRWDAERSTGRPEPIAPDLAADGIDELLEVFAPWASPAEGGPQGRIHLSSTDVNRGWDLAVDGADVTAAGTASDLLLVLWGRLPPEDVHVTGEPASLHRWQADVQI